MQTNESKQAQQRKMKQKIHICSYDRINGIHHYERTVSSLPPSYVLYVGNDNILYLYSHDDIFYAMLKKEDWVKKVVSQKQSKPQKKDLQQVIAVLLTVLSIVSVLCGVVAYNKYFNVGEYSTSTIKHTSHDIKTNTVYITDTGKKYHKRSCSALAKSCHSISRSKAVSKGYTSCNKCKP